jgi:transcriptional regulator with XRE-family HTH domain
MTTFRTATGTAKRLKRQRDLVGLTEVMRLARAAAGLAMQGDYYSREDRADAAAAITLRVWETARAAGTNGMAVVMAPSSLSGPAPKMAKGATAKTTPRKRVMEDAVPSSLVTMSKLYGHACNLRVTIRRDRERDLQQAAEDARTGAFLAHGPALSYGVPADPAHAHDAAHGMLLDLGLDSDPEGSLYRVAYAAAREAAGLTGEEIAAELGIRRGTLAQQINRAATKVPSAQTHTAREHAEALHVDEYVEPPRPQKASLPESNGERLKPGHRYPQTRAIVPSLPVTERKLAGGRRKWNGNATAAWTDGLPGATRARLRKSAQLQRARAAAKTAEQRKLDRLSAGLRG